MLCRIIATMSPFKWRILIAASLISIGAAGFVLSSAPDLTKKQKRALAICNLNYITCDDSCLSQGSLEGLAVCRRLCDDDYRACLDRAGIPFKGYPKAPVDTGARPKGGGNPPIKPTPTTTPRRRLPTPVHGGNAPIAPTPSPSGTPGPTLLYKNKKPSPTPRPHRSDHHQG